MTDKEKAKEIEEDNKMTVKIKYEDDGKGKWQSVSARVEVDGDDYFLPGIAGFGETEEEAKEDLKSKIIPLLVQVENVLQLGKPKWHDLRKDLDDLPKESGDYYVCFEDMTQTVHYWNNDHWCFSDKPIAWCELPKFKE